MLTVVRACLRDGAGGSPTAVLDDPSPPDPGFRATPLSDPERRAVPGSVGASHAVFIAPDGSVRFFTSTGELPACGHGTVAALALLTHRTGRPENALRIGGRIFPGRAVPRRDAFPDAADGPAAVVFDVAFDPGPITVRPPTRAEISEISAAIGTTAAPEACVATLGRPRLLLPVADRETVANLEPDLDRLRLATDRLGLLGCYAYSVPDYSVPDYSVPDYSVLDHSVPDCSVLDASGRAAARMFAPSIGVPEDIANANSTACLAAHLRTALRVDMGDSLGSPATVTASVQPGGGVLVGGLAAVPASGSLTTT